MPSHGPEGDPHGILTNPWEDFVRESQDLSFAAVRPQFGSRTFQDYFRNRGRTRFLQDYNTAVAQQALSGEAPTLDLLDFGRTYPFQARFQDLTPRQRGELGASSSRLNFLNSRRR